MENAAVNLPLKKSPKHFRFGPVLGEGSFSTVRLATEISTGKEFAMKVLLKRHICKEKKAFQVDREKRILNRLVNHPYFVTLFFTFQDPERLYFGLSVARRGELHSKIKHLGRFDLKCTRFYSSQIIAALEYMHGLDIIHRDLKPENILFNDEMNIQITDFGTAKDLSNPSRKPPAREAESTGEDGDRPATPPPVDVWMPRTSTFVGTAEFIAPEVLVSKQACACSDIWALGCIIFQMITGEFAFHTNSEYLTLSKVQACDYKLPETLDKHIADIIRKILVKDPLERLGSRELGGYQVLKSHPFFNGVDWENIYSIPVPDSIMEVLMSDSSDDETGADQMCDDFDSMFFPSDAEAIPLEIIQHFPNGNTSSSEKMAVSSPSDVSGFGLPPSLPMHEKARWLQKQKTSNEWDYYAGGKLILKQGPLEKKRKLSTKAREFLLLEGPRLIYIDPSSKSIKGEIPWSADMRTELKNFRWLDIHTPKRTYHLIDKSNNAMKWCKQIDRVKNYYFPATATTTTTSDASDDCGEVPTTSKKLAG